MSLTQQMRTKSSFIAIYCDLQAALRLTLQRLPVEAESGYLSQTVIQRSF